MLGIDIPLTQDIHAMADFIGGNNAIGTAVAGLMWQANTHWQFSLGAQIPTPQVSSHEYGVVFEITRL